MNFRPGLRRREPRVAVVSLIDVVLQLVIFLLLTTTFKTGEFSLDVAVPEADSAAPRVSDSITIEIARDGTLVLEGRQVRREEIGTFLKEKAADSRYRRVTIRADREATHGNVVDVMDLAMKSDVRSLAIAAVPTAMHE